MEKRKIVKPIVIAASVAAVVGIGAVSFAAWNGTASKDNDVAGGVTGHVDLTGFAATSTTSLTDKLMPQDQSTIGTGETKAYHIKLVIEGNDAANYKIQGSYTAQKDGADYTWASGSSLAYVIDQSATTAYDAAWTTWTPSATDADLTYTGTLAAGDYYVHVALVSSASADMDVDLAFSFKLAEKSA